MRNNLLLSMMLAIASIFCTDAKHTVHNDHSQDFYKIDRMTVGDSTFTLIDTVNPALISISRVKYGSSTKDILMILGQPTKKETVYNEILSQSEEKLWYGKSFITNVGGHMRSYAIYDQTLKLEVSDTVISIGDSISVIRRLFPSLAMLAHGDQATVRLRLATVDAYLIFSILNNRIYAIYHWDDV